MRSRLSRRVVVGLALGTVVTLGLGSGVAAAGGGGSGGGNQFSNLKRVKPPSPCKDDPGVSDGEIKVGVLLPLSGASAVSFGPGRDGIQARIDAANAAGETGKRKITLEYADDAADPGRNVTAAQDLVEQKKVFALIENSLAADASAEYLSQAGVPVVGWQLGLGAFGKYTNFFGWRNSNAPDPKTFYTTRTADVLKKYGARKIALVGTNNANSATFIEQIADALKRTKGMKVAYKTTDVAPGATEFGSIAQQIKESGADGVYTGMDFQQNIALNGALKQAGVTPTTVLFPGGYDPRVTGIANMDGAVFGVEFIPFELNPPAYEKFAAAMGDGNKNQVTAIGWMAADALIEGIKQSGVSCPTRKAFINNLRLTKGYTGNGFFDPVDFSKEFGKPFVCAYYVKVENKQFVPQFDGQHFCATRFVKDGKVTKVPKSLIPKGGPQGGVSTTTTAPAAGG